MSCVAILIVIGNCHRTTDDNQLFLGHSDTYDIGSYVSCHSI